MRTAGRCSEPYRPGPWMASTIAFRTGERTRKRGRSRPCSEYHTGCLSPPSSVYGLLPTSSPPRPQSIAPCRAYAATGAATVAPKSAIHVSWRSRATLHARLWTARFPRRQLSSERSLFSFTIIHTNNRWSRRIEFSRFYTGADPGECACRHRSACRREAQTKYCSLGYVVDRCGPSRVTTKPFFCSTLSSQEKDQIGQS
jgi:hypothetical protein